MNVRCLLKVVFITALFNHAAFALAASVTRVVSITKPTIVVFLPPNIEHGTDDGSIEAAAHASYAVSDTLKCLKPKTVRVITVFADRVVLKLGKKRLTKVVAELGQGVGAMLTELGREPRVVYATDGPSALVLMLPEAAAEYWQTSACRGAS